MKTKALVIVAHPDDETIWMGGTILRNEEWNWNIIAICRARDKDREPKFRKVCKSLNAKSFIFDLDDSEDGYFKELVVYNINKKILSVLKNNNYDYVFTHNKNGEYKHIRHINVNEAVNKLIDDKKIKCKNIFYFNYYKNENENFCRPNPKSNLKIRLTKDEFDRKRKLIKDIYGFNESSFEMKSASKEETFAMGNAR